MKKKVFELLTLAAASPVHRPHGRQKVSIPECDRTGRRVMVNRSAALSLNTGSFISNNKMLLPTLTYSVWCRWNLPCICTDTKLQRVSQNIEISDLSKCSPLNSVNLLLTRKTETSCLLLPQLASSLCKKLHLKHRKFSPAGVLPMAWTHVYINIWARLS